MRHLHILNLRAGVQSSTLAMMFTRKELDPHPDYAIFADTQNESADTYNWLKMLEGKVTFPINKVTKGNLIDDVYKTMNRKDGEKMVRGASIPFHVTKHDGKKGMTHRRCTSSYKIEMIEKEIRRILEIPFRHRFPKDVWVHQYFGISTDEMTRMKIPQRKNWSFHYPLINKQMSRQDCIKYMTDLGLGKPPKSACIYCPFHDNAAWIDMKRNRPDEWSECVKIDKDLRKAGPKLGLTQAADLYLHKSRQPLDEIDFENKDQYSLFEDGCDGGYCGV